MKTISATLCLASIAALVTFAGLPAQARTHHRHAAGHSDRVATKKMEKSPGVTKDIAPDAKQSGTGGQAGGLPGSE